MKTRFVEAHQPIQPGFERIGQGVGVLANDEVSFLQAENALGFNAEWSQALFRSRFA